MKMIDACKYGLEHGCVTIGDVKYLFSVCSKEIFSECDWKTELFELITDSVNYDNNEQIEKILAKEKGKSEEREKNTMKETLYVLCDDCTPVRIYYEKKEAFLGLFNIFVDNYIAAKEEGAEWVRNPELVYSDLEKLIKFEPIEDGSILEVEVEKTKDYCATD